MGRFSKEMFIGMSHIMLLFLTLVPIFSFSQNHEIGVPLLYGGVEYVDATTKDDLYIRAKMILNSLSIDANQSIKVDDKEIGVISAKYTLPYDHTIDAVDGVISFLVTIYIKDGRYKYDISEFVHRSYENNYSYLSYGLITEDEKCPYPNPTSGVKKMTDKWYHKLWTKIQSTCNYNASSIEAYIKDEMTKSISMDNDDW